MCYNYYNSASKGVFTAALKSPVIGHVLFLKYICNFTKLITELLSDVSYLERHVLN